MRRFSYLVVLLISAITLDAQEMPNNSVPQHAPCLDQPRSRKELAVSFQKGQFPQPSQVNGTWVEIGDLSDYPSSDYSSLNCSGEKRGSQFEFVLVANGYSLELHAIGMTYPQKVTMEPDHKGSVTFPVDFAADEGPQIYRCRLTRRHTLVCLVDRYDGVEFKKMTVGEEQIYHVTETP